MNGTSANASRIKSAAPKSIEQQEFRSASDNSDASFDRSVNGSFNETLKEEQKSSEGKFEVTSKKTEKTSEREGKSEEVKDSEEAVVVDAVEKQPEESEVVEKAEEQGAFVQSKETEEKGDASKVVVEETEGETDMETVKSKTLMSLLSGEKKSKYPKMEQYIANLRSEGKSTKEILTSLKKVVNDLEEKGEVTLKGFVLKVKKVGDEENPEAVKVSHTNEEKKTVALEDVDKADKETEKPIVNNKKSESMVSLKTEMKETERNPEIVSEKNNHPEVVQRVVIKSETPEKTEMIQKQSVQKGNVGKEDIKISLTNEIEIPEKLVKFLEHYEKVDFEKISSFFESKLIPPEEVERFINSFNFNDTEAFVERNEAILAQLSDFSKLFDPAKTSNVFTQVKTVTVKSEMVQQFLIKSFNERNFSNDFWNSRNNVVFKTKESSQIVQKLTVNFERMTQSVRTEVRGTQNSISELSSRTTEEMQRGIQNADKAVVKAAFLRTGYESPISRRASLNQTTEQAAVQKEEASPKTEVFQSPLKQIDALKETVEKLQNKVSENTESKNQTEVKDTKGQVSSEHANHSAEKISASFTSTVLNRQVVNSSNLEQVYQRISDMTKMMERQMSRVETTTIQLTPPELGKVSLEVVKEGLRISIFMQVETKDAQEILQKNSEALAARLSGSGFELQKVQIQMEKFEEQGTDQQNQNTDSQNNQNNENDENNSNESASDFDNEAEYSFADLLKGGIEDAG
jgi:flagellar hook-length control protein FliK